MPELFSNSVFLLIAYLLILAVMIIAALYVLSRVRSYPIQKEQSELSAAEYLNSFQELKTQGKLSDEEFRFIKKRLSAGIVREQSLSEDVIAALSVSNFDLAVILDRFAVERQNSGDNGVDDERNREETQFIRKDSEDTVIEKKNG